MSWIWAGGGMMALGGVVSMVRGVWRGRRKPHR